MTEFTIFSPRWRDQTILLGVWKLKRGEINKVIIKNHPKQFPHPLYVSTEIALQYPVEIHKSQSGNEFKVRAVPINEFRANPDEVQQ